MNKTYEMDMCNGPVLKKILIFSIPLMLSGVLQLLFNAADIIVVGRFAGSQSLAAVGSTTALINLLINIFIGLSVGANVVVARAYGGRRDKDVSEAVHTAIAVSIVSGVILIVMGFVFSKLMLELMGTPDDVIDKAVLYMRIYFAGMPVVMLYNFGSAILRAVGDTRRPLYFLTIAGVVNIVLNLFFVIVMNLDVAGVALATVISQCISSGLVLRCLAKSEGGLKLELSKIKIHRKKMLQIFKIGLPAGMQGAIFSVSNVLIQSSVNSFGSIAMAGNAASANIEGFVYNAMNAVYQTNLSFTSQNIGGKKYTRVNRILFACLGTVTVVGMILGFGAYAIGDELLLIYSTDPEVIRFGMLRMSIIATTYFTCGWMDTMVGSLRGMGYSVLPMIVSLTGACGLRILWIFTIFAQQRTLTSLYISYPVSWVITAGVHMLCYFLIKRKLPKKDGIV
ncbi:MAG TPA: MATE family efflux transporter [Lacrimispora saccharolytica]|nr:MATE family efflux transporter [Lacrimispora saccharolytica]